MVVDRYEEDSDGYLQISTEGYWVTYKDYQELEAENARLRQQRDAANAQLDFILENLKPQDVD